MLTREQNERLCRVGPGTPMGRLFRCFWLPICTSAELPEPDCDPVRVRLVGQNFVAFRDTAGRVGLLDASCPHRGASLALGRVEEGGIRCLYHGWKFAVDGKLLDTPNCSSRAIRERVRAPAYAVREAGGLVWAFLGPQDQAPPFTQYAFMDAAPENRTVVRVNVNCNYLQLTEGGFDSSHVGILHSDVARPDWLVGKSGVSHDMEHPGTLAVVDNDPELELTQTDFGFYYAAFRNGGADEQGKEKLNVRVVPFMLPFTRIIPSPTTLFTVFETPSDDESTSTYIVVHGKSPVDRNRIISILGLDDARFWSQKDFAFRARLDDGFLQDRERMKSSWSGFRGLEQEDAVIALSMGKIFDRSIEHLIPADRAVNHIRHLLLQLADRLQKGVAVALPENLTDVCAPDAFLLRSERPKWRDLVPNHWNVPQQMQDATTSA